MEKENIIKNFYKCWDSRDRELYEKTISKQIVDHDSNPNIIGNDFDKIWNLLSSLDGLTMDHKIEQMYKLEENKIFVRWDATAQHIGSLMGIPATNKTVYYSGHDIFKLNDENMIIEIWHIEQLLQMMEQLK